MSSVTGTEVQVSPKSFTINQDEPTFNIRIRVEDDKTCETKSLAFFMECFDGDALTLRKSPVALDRYNVPVLNTTPLDKCEDPRFLQSILGQDENGIEKPVQICYNIIGQRGDVVEFLGDSKLGKFISKKYNFCIYYGRFFFR